MEHIWSQTHLRIAILQEAFWQGQWQTEAVCRQWQRDANDMLQGNELLRLKRYWESTTRSLKQGFPETIDSAMFGIHVILGPEVDRRLIESHTNLCKALQAYYHSRPGDA